MTKLERQETALLRMASRAHSKAQKLGGTKATPVPQGHKEKLKKARTFIPFAESEALPYTTPEQHHHISPSHNTPLHLTSSITKNKDDPAIKVSQFLDHLNPEPERTAVRIFCPNCRSTC
jgi:hypothetical protein